MNLTIASRALAGLSLAAFVLSVFFSAGSLSAADEPRWWKGNLHTHSLWSDGDDYPEMIVDWYKSHGYHFLMLSDHNILSEGDKWISATNNRGGAAALEKYLKRFGPAWVQQRVEENAPQVRLKTWREMTPIFDEAGRFLLMQGEELSDRWKTAPIHINITNLRELILPQGGDTVLEVIQNNFDAIHEQRRRTGQPILPHLNHPNFQWAITAEEFMRVRGGKFFEVYNGHPSVHNEGDATHAGTERFWDIILTRRLDEFGMDVLFGLATDDSHNYHEQGPKRSNTGRGWVVVRSDKLTPEAILGAMEAGDFYASSGVSLREVRREKDRLSLEIDAEQGVTYRTEFIGTRRGYDPRNEPVRAANGEALRVTHRYSADIGAVLAVADGASPSYTLRGDEIYVRARVISSKLKENPYRAGEFEMAWSQPVVPAKGPKPGASE